MTYPRFGERGMDGWQVCGFKDQTTQAGWGQQGQPTLPTCWILVVSNPQGSSQLGYFTMLHHSSTAVGFLPEGCGRGCIVLRAQV